MGVRAIAPVTDTSTNAPGAGATYATRRGANPPAAGGEMTEVRHFQDRDHVFTGHEGEWTMCGQPWTPQPAGEDVPACPDCVDAAIGYADSMRQGQR